MIEKYAVAAVALMVALVGSSGAAAADQPGQKFIKEAIQGNLAEVKVGQLAQEKGASPGVKEFGGTLAKDHEMANQGATEAAQQMNVTPPDKPGMKQQAAYTKLAALSGETFDRQFVKSMVKDHQEDISKYEQGAQQGGPAGDYAKKTLPKLRDHLKMAEDLQHGQHVATATKNSMAQ